MKWVLILASVVVGAFIVVIAVPNLIAATHRSRQKRAMADIRAISTAWEARAMDRKSYWTARVRGSEGLPSAVRIAPSELEALLTPTYMRSLPHADAWGTEYQFTCSDFDASGNAGSYAIRSLGSDGRPDRVANAGGATRSFSDDIVYSDGWFV